MPVWAQGVRIEDILPNFDVFSLGKVLWWMVSGLHIQRLQLWYFEKPGVNVEGLFPDRPFIRMLNPLLAKCVVEEENDCLPDATALLDEIDKCRQIIERNADLIDEKTTRMCKTCGLGTFHSVTDENDLSAMGVRKMGGRRCNVECCDHCGYVQVFFFRD